MKKRTSLLLIPLGVALIYLGSVASKPPGAERRPAPSLLAVPQISIQEQQPDIDVAAMIAEIDYPPAQEAAFEVVIALGTVGERKAAIQELRHLGTDSAVRILSIALGNDDRRIRKAAFEALSRIGGDDALAAIASASASDDAVMRTRAVEALGNAGGYSAADYLELALRDEDPRVRATAVMALGDLNDSRSVNIISVALRDPDVGVRQRAAEMLDELNDEALFHTLYPAL